MRPALGLALLLLLSIQLGGGCQGKPPDVDGVGAWSATKTKRRHATGRCDETQTPVWCYAQTPLKLGNNTAEVDLYFASNDPDARLVELLLKVHGCKDDELLAWLRRAWGNPLEDKGQKVYWQNGSVFVAGLAPSEPGMCLVRIIPNAEADAIAKIRAE